MWQTSKQKRRFFLLRQKVSQENNTLNLNKGNRIVFNDNDKECYCFKKKTMSPYF